MKSQRRASTRDAAVIAAVSRSPSPALERDRDPPAGRSHARSWRHETSSFVGREGDLLALERHHADGARLVTVLGPAGVGKTRLARQYARQRADRGEAVWFCDLTAAQTTADLLAAVAAPLDVILAFGATVDEVSDRIGADLATRKDVVLVLDNFEHLIAHAEMTVDRWLEQAPSAVFIATSRQPLGLEEEVRFELSPLDLDHGIALFEDRVRSLNPISAITEETRPIAAEIVRQLDGLPLAIELAAMRMVLLRPAEILARLPQRFDLLRSGIRHRSPRHATLEQAIAWSWDLLTLPEQAALAQCSVFRGGFSIEAVEAVLDLGAFPGAPPIIDVVQALREKSLVRAFAAPAFDESRLGLYESIREFAAAKLRASGARRAIAERHARYYVGEAEVWSARASGPAWAACLDRLALELHNLQAVANRTEESPALGVRATLALDTLLSVRGPHETRLKLLDDAVTVLDRLEDPTAALRALMCRTSANLNRGALKEAHEDNARARALAERAGTPGFEAPLLLQRLEVACYLSTNAAYRVSVSEYGPLADAAIDAARRSGDDRTLALGIAMRAWFTGILPEDSSALDAMVASVEGMNEPRVLAAVLFFLGGAYLRWGRLREARAHMDRSLSYARQVGDRCLDATVQCLSSFIDLCDGDFVAAASHFEAALTANDAMGNWFWSPVALAGYGITLLNMPEHVSGAASRFERVLSAAGAPRNVWATTLAQAGLCAARALEGRLDEAAQCLAASRSYPGTTEDPTVALMLHLCEGVLEEMQAREAGARGDEAAAQRLRRSALARLREWVDEPSTPGAPLELRVTPRFGALAAFTTGRVLERVVAGEDLQRPLRMAASASGVPSVSTARDLEIGPLCQWFRAAGGTMVDLSARPTQRRLLAALAEQHAVAPGTALGAQALIKTLWPGERAALRLHLGRLHNAVATLRGLGLRKLILTNERAYLLDPAASILQLR